MSLSEEFVSAVRENEAGPVALLLVSFFQQAVVSSGAVTGPILSCLPSDLVSAILYQASFSVYAKMAAAN